MVVQSLATQLHLRDAVEEDLQAIVDIYNMALASRMITAGTSTVTVPGRLDWFNAHTPKRPLWVAELDDKVIGWLSFSLYHVRPAYHITAELSIYIAQDHQRQGWGSRMLRGAIEHAPALGIRRLAGLIMATNVAALRFFAKAGFQQWGRLPHVMEIDGIERDLMIVGRKSG